MADSQITPAGRFVWWGWLMRHSLLISVGVLVLIAVTEYFSENAFDPSAFLMVCIASVTFIGGVQAGAISGVISFVYLVYFFQSSPSHDALSLQLVVVGLAILMLIGLVGFLRRRADQATEVRIDARAREVLLQSERHYQAELAEANRLRERALAEAELLHTLALVASGEDDLGKILASALDELTRLVRFSGGSIALVEGDALVICAAIGPFTSQALGERLPRSASRSWPLIDSGQPFLCNDLAAAGLRSTRADEGDFLRSYLAVPLVWRGQVFGLLEIDSIEAEAFQPTDVHLLQAIATALSGPIEMARRYTHQVQERHRMEQLAAERDAILRQIVDGVVLADPQGVITFYNAAAQRLYGTEVPQPHVQEATIDGSPYQPNDMPLLRAAQFHETVVDAEWRIRRPAGSEIIVQGSATPVVGEDGTRLGGVLVLRDVTTQRALEHQKDELFSALDHALDEAQAAQHRLAFLATVGTALVTAIDYEDSLAQVARRLVPDLADWCAIHTVEPGMVLHRQVLICAQGDERVQLEAALDGLTRSATMLYGPSAVIQSGRAELMTYGPNVIEAVAGDAALVEGLRRLRGCSMICVPLRVRGGLFGTITLARSAPNQRYALADLTLAEELARRAALVVENALLYREAQAAILTRDQFLSLASHELKTPLTALIGHTQLFQRRDTREQHLSERDRRTLSIIAGQAHRLNKLIGAMLDFSRLQSGHFGIEFACVDLNALICRVVEETQLATEHHTLHLVTVDEPLLIRGDVLRLEHVIQNLISNAIKYSPAADSIIVQVEQQQGSARVAVIDHGIGIPADALPQLFQRFYRAQNVVGNQIGGVGLGLYVVKEIVSLHGGSIEVTSREGEGSTFTVCLPLLDSEQRPVEVRESVHSAATNDHAFGGWE